MNKKMHSKELKLEIIRRKLAGERIIDLVREYFSTENESTKAKGIISWLNKYMKFGQSLIIHKI